MEVNKMVNHRSNSGSGNSNRIDSNRKNNNITKKHETCICACRKIKTESLFKESKSMEEMKAWRVWMGLSIYCTKEELEMVRDYMAQEEGKTMRAVKDACRYYGLEYEEV